MPFSPIHLLPLGVFAGSAQQPLPVVMFETDKGSIDMEVDSVRALVTARGVRGTKSPGQG